MTVTYERSRGIAVVFVHILCLSPCSLEATMVSEHPQAC